MEAMMKTSQMNSEFIEELFNSYSLYRSPQCNVPQLQSGDVKVGAFDEPDAFNMFLSNPSREQQQRISELAQRLVRMADEFEQRHSKLDAGSGDSEKESKFLIVQKIATDLKEKVTLEAFNEALKTVCQHATSVPEELTLAFELATQIGPVLNFIPRLLGEYFQSRVQMEDLEDIQQM